MPSRPLVWIGFLNCLLVATAVLRAQEKPAPDAQYFEVIKTDDVYGLDLMEDLRHAVFAHQDANRVSVWDIQTLKKVASFESPAPRTVLCRGSAVYVGSAEASLLSVYDGAKKWKKTEEIKLPLANVATLSAPGGKAFKGQLLALCDIDKKQRQMVFIDTKTKQARTVDDPREISAATVDFEGKNWIVQGAGGSPARAINSIKSWPLLVAGRDSPSGPTRYDTLPIIRQVQPGPFWIGGNRICKGMPPIPMGKVRDQFVIADRSKQLAYVFSNRSTLEALELTGTLESVGSRKVFFPEEHGRFIEMNPHVTCFYDFLSFAVTGKDRKLRIFSYDGHQKLVWTLAVAAFPGEDARIQPDSP